VTSAWAAAIRASARRWSESAAACCGARPTSAPGGRRPSAIIRISASTAAESSESPIALGDAARRLLIPALLAIVLAGCGEDSGSSAGTGDGAARECADSWSASAGDALPYMSDLAKAGADSAFVGAADGECVIYVQNPGDQGEVYVFTARGDRWSAPKRGDVPELRRLDGNARVLAGGRIELD
jgi:hypothetical protein